MAREMSKDSFSFLCLACETELLQELSQCRVQAVAKELKKLEIFLCHKVAKVIPGGTEVTDNRNLCKIILLQK